MNEIPVPTSEQCTNFAEHVADVHSWYKHLPILSGGKFIIFLDKNAGVNYPLKHPPIKSGNTQEGYLHDFGHLNYVYKLHSDDIWNCDCNCDQYEIIKKFVRSLPMPIIEQCTFTLYPMISWEFEEAYNACHKEYFKKLVSENHPYADLLLKWESFHKTKDELWNNMTDYERDLSYKKAYCMKSEEIADINIPEIIKNYDLAEENEYQHLKQIRDVEYQKIVTSINRLKIIIEG